MLRETSCIFILVLISLRTAYAENDMRPPRVVSTFPANESQDVDPSVHEISVTFDEEMMDGSWSWVYRDKHEFPHITGQAYYRENTTKNVLPVRLEPNKEYVIWINSAKHRNFRDKSGNSAVPFKFTFQTKQAPDPSDPFHQ